MNEDTDNRSSERTEGRTAERTKSRTTGRVGVLIVNMGTPLDPSVKAVRRYLRKFLMDPRIRPMNRILWWILLQTRILSGRSETTAKKYEAIWTPEGFAFNSTHQRIVEGLNAHYHDLGEDVVVRCAMCHGEPSMEHSITQLKDEGCKRLVVLPLYPQSAYSTVGSVSDGLSKALRKASWQGEVDFIDGYHEDQLYIGAIAASIRHAGFDPASDDRLLLSYHSIPLADIEAGDTYELQVDATSLAIADELGLDRYRWTIGYQSRFDNARQWLSPFTRQILASWAESGSKARVFVVCPNFSVDCLETTYDIGHEMRPGYLNLKAAWEAESAGVHLQGKGRRDFDEEQAEQSGRRSHRGRAYLDEDILGRWYGDGSDPVSADDDAFVYVPSLNKSKAHVKVLAHVLAPYVEGGSDDE